MGSWSPPGSNLPWSQAWLRTSMKQGHGIYLWASSCVGWDKAKAHGVVSCHPHLDTQHLPGKGNSASKGCQAASRWPPASPKPSEAQCPPLQPAGSRRTSTPWETRPPNWEKRSCRRCLIHVHVEVLHEMLVNSMARAPSSTLPGPVGLRSGQRGCGHTDRVGSCPTAAINHSHCCSSPPSRPGSLSHSSRRRLGLYSSRGDWGRIILQDPTTSNSQDSMFQSKVQMTFLSCNNALDLLLHMRQLSAQETRKTKLGGNHPEKGLNPHLVVAKLCDPGKLLTSLSLSGHFSKN